MVGVLGDIGHGRGRPEVGGERLAAPGRLDDQHLRARVRIVHSEAEAVLGANEIFLAIRTEARREASEAGRARRRRDDRAVHATLGAVFVVPASER